MVTWKCEYVCEIVVSPVRTIFNLSGTAFEDVIIDDPLICNDGTGLSSSPFNTVEPCISIVKVGVFVNPTNACS